MTKRTLLIALTISLFSFVSKADQLAWISLHQAESAVVFLNKNPEIISWCACCQDNEKTLIRIKNSYYKHAATADDYYEVFISGIDNNGNNIDSAFDLAYLHYKADNGLATCVGIELGFKCDPCTAKFRWPYNGYNSNSPSEADSDESESTPVIQSADNLGFVYVGKTNDGEEYFVQIEKRDGQSVDAWVKRKIPVKYIKNSKRENHQDRWWISTFVFHFKL